MPQKININNNEYEVIDAKEKMTVPDCWVLKNKIGGGYGEAKFYIGNEGEQLFNFFDELSRWCFCFPFKSVIYLENVT